MRIRINQIMSHISALAFCVTFSCTPQNVIETPSGLEVEMIRSSNGEKFEIGDELEVNLVYETKDGKKLFDTRKIGAPVKIRMTDSDRGLFHEMIQMLSVGDSATCEISVDNLYEETFQRSVPDSIAKGTMLKFNIGIVSAKNLTEKIEAQKKIDAELIDQYLAKNNIEAETDTTGLRYVVTKKGNGPKPSIGDSVLVHYTGKLMENGKKFDSSKDRGTPFEFSIGRGVIEGWSRGFALLNEGDEATLYIPSGMAYGPGGYPGTIPPNAILVFDVEFLEIKK